MEKVGLTTHIYDFQPKEDKNNAYTCLSLNGCNWLSDTFKKNGLYKSKEASPPPSQKKNESMQTCKTKGKNIIQRQLLKMLHTGKN